MTGLGVFTAVGLVAGGLLTVLFLARACLKLASGLADVGQQVASLRREVIDYRAAHDHAEILLHRRLQALEEASASAMNEVRMASDQLVARLPLDSGHD